MKISINFHIANQEILAKDMPCNSIGLLIESGSVKRYLLRGSEVDDYYCFVENDIVNWSNEKFGTGDGGNANSKVRLLTKDESITLSNS